MSRPTRAKYCPQCHAMNFVEATVCVYCEHEFRTDASAAAPPSPSDKELHRTQMFTLPPMAARPTVDTPTRPPGGIASLLGLLRASPLIPVIVLLALVVLALLGLAVTSFR